MWLSIWTPDPSPPQKSSKLSEVWASPPWHRSDTWPHLRYRTSRGGKTKAAPAERSLKEPQHFPTKALQSGRAPQPRRGFPPTPERKAAVPGTIWLALWPDHGLSCWSEGPPSQVVFIMCLELQPGSTVTFKWDGWWDLTAAGAALRPRGLHWRNLQAAGAVLNSCHLELI